MQWRWQPTEGFSRRWVPLLALFAASVQVAGQTSVSPQSTPPQSVATPAAQPQPEQVQSDLTQAAQQAREEREHQPAKRSENSQAVDEMAAELSDQPEQDLAAPVGYRYYNFKPGDYSILVPADAAVEGRSSYGLTLLSSESMGSRTVVILGDPIPAQGSTNDEILTNAAKQYFYGCSVGIRHAGQPLNGHPASDLRGFSMCPLHREVSGYARFVIGDGYVMPMICGYPFTAEDLDPNPKRPVAEIIKKYDREETGFRACDVVFPSLRFREHGSQWSPTRPAPPHNAGVPATLSAASSAEGAGPAQNDSLGSFARTHKKNPSTDVLTELQHTPPGYSSFNFDYCLKQECFSASLQIPVKSRRAEQFRLDYLGLFAFEVPLGDTVAVIQATKASSTAPGVLSREQLIATKVAWCIDNVPAVYFGKPAKTDVLAEDLTTVSDMPVRRLTLHSMTTFQPVITRLAVYMAPGVFVQIRCSVPEKAYAEAQEMCEHVVNSLEVPQAKTMTNDNSTSADND